VADHSRPAAPATISTSPAENTLASGTQRGVAKRSISHGRLGWASETLLACTPCSTRPSERSAADEAGMWPPFANMAATLDARPRPISGVPGMRRLKAVPAASIA
jgi:hypothetical protein